MRKLKVALVHEFLNQFGGGERVLEAFVEMFPEAEIYTLLYDENKMANYFKNSRINTSFLQPFRKLHKYLLPLMPKAIESIRIPKDVDLVLSDSSAFAKGVKVPADVPHICYLHTPTRYLWLVREEYLEGALPSYLRPLKVLIEMVLDKQRVWDYLAAQKPSCYIANSDNIAKKLYSIYDRKTTKVIFPFVEMNKYKISEPEDYALALGRIEPYKRFDLAIEGSIRANMNIKVVGTGTKLEELKKRYGHSKLVHFLGRVDDEELLNLYSRAKVYIFPQEEDAGITPLEAMASGCPVLAYRQGGALESIQEGVSGYFFDQQNADEVAKSLLKYNWQSLDRAKIRKSVEKFDLSKFKEEILELIDQLV